MRTLQLQAPSKVNGASILPSGCANCQDIHLITLNAVLSLLVRAPYLLTSAPLWSVSDALDPEINLLLEFAVALIT